MANIVKVVSTGMTGLAAMFAANAGHAQTSVATSVPVNVAPVTTSGSQSAAAAEGGAANLDANLANTSQNANANSLQDNSTTNNNNANQNANALNAKQTNAQQTAVDASQHNTTTLDNTVTNQNAVANSAKTGDIKIDAPDFTAPAAISGGVAVLLNAIGTQHRIGQACVNGKIVIMTQGDGPLSANKAEGLGVEVDPKFAKAMGIKKGADRYVDCPVEEPRLGFTQAPVAAPAPKPEMQQLQPEPEPATEPKRQYRATAHRRARTAAPATAHPIKPCPNQVTVKYCPMPIPKLGK